MLKTYYYLSSLSTLSFTNDKPMSKEEFINLSTNGLTQEELDLVLQATLDVKETESEIAILKEWFQFEVGLRNELIKARAQLLSVDPNEYYVKDQTGSLLNVRPLLPEIVKSALSQNPYDAEITLLQYRWHFLEELEVGKYFTFDNVIIYYLKLQILQKKASISSLQKGQNNFKLAYEEVYKGFKESIKL